MKKSILSTALLLAFTAGSSATTLSDDVRACNTQRKGDCIMLQAGTVVTYGVSPNTDRTVAVFYDHKEYFVPKDRVVDNEESVNSEPNEKTAAQVQKKITYHWSKNNKMLHMTEMCIKKVADFYLQDFENDRSAYVMKTYAETVVQSISKGVCVNEMNQDIANGATMDQIVGYSAAAALARIQMATIAEVKAWIYEGN